MQKCPGKGGLFVFHVAQDGRVGGGGGRQYEAGSFVGSCIVPRHLACQLVHHGHLAQACQEVQGICHASCIWGLGACMRGGLRLPGTEAERRVVLCRR